MGIQMVFCKALAMVNLYYEFYIVLPPCIQYYSCILTKIGIYPGIRISRTNFMPNCTLVHFQKTYLSVSICKIHNRLGSLWRLLSVRRN